MILQTNITQKETDNIKYTYVHCTVTSGFVSRFNVLRSYESGKMQLPDDPFFPGMPTLPENSNLSLN